MMATSSSGASQNRSFIRAFVVLGVLAVGAWGWHWYLSRRAGLDPWLIAQRDRLTLGFERPGVLFYGPCWKCYNPAATEPPNWSTLVAVTTRGAQYVDDIHQIRGLVRITRPEQALNFVRFRSWPCAFLSEGDAFEVVDSRQALQLPDFGAGCVLQLVVYKPFRDSGLNGVLSEQAYRKGGFSPARVVALHGRFVVTHWLLVSKGGEAWRVQKVEDVVAPDGALATRVLSDQRAPPLPGTHWGAIGTK